LESVISLAVSWLPFVIILGVLLFTGRRLSRQYGENLELSRHAVEAIRENTSALRELTRRMEGR
jgi:hypothetical protein